MVGKILYGILFMLVLPLLSTIWAIMTTNSILLLVPQIPFLGESFIFLGLLGMCWAFKDLWILGKGLPMNAYPPEKLVISGIYRWFSHPIYISASVLSFGLALIFQSASAFWLVSPTLTISWIALILGFEGDDLKRRFQEEIISYQPIFNLPKNSSLSATWTEKFITSILVFGTWLILYELVIFLPISPKSIETFLPFEKQLPVIQWTEIFYIFCYVYALVTPFILSSKSELRNFGIGGLILTLSGIYLQFILPFIAPPKAFEPSNILGELLIWERKYDNSSAAFPSFHVAWAVFSTYYFQKHFPKLSFFWQFLNLSIIISCLTTGMHSILDVIFGLILSYSVLYREFVWKIIKNYFEKLANSWNSIMIGKLRIINHSIYAGLSAFSGFLLCCMLLEDPQIVSFVAFFSLIGAGIWAQLVEGSSGLSRPFGYYGSIFGGLIGTVVASFIFDVPIMKILCAFALVSPVIQGIGRWRCVVQGCCHGKIADEYWGIKVNHEKSRVCALSHLKNQPIHITPLYSIVSNILIMGVLWRLWYAEC
jgi:protein-S-isoprenylcysteine O-methyltransferase Ste14